MITKEEENTGSHAKQVRYAELQEEQEQVAKHDVFPAHSYEQASGSESLASESRAKQRRYAELQEEQEQMAKQASGYGTNYQAKMEAPVTRLEFTYKHQPERHEAKTGIGTNYQAKRAAPVTRREYEAKYQAKTRLEFT